MKYVPYPMCVGSIPLLAAAAFIHDPVRRHIKRQTIALHRNLPVFLVPVSVARQFGRGLDELKFTQHDLLHVPVMRRLRYSEFWIMPLGLQYRPGFRRDDTNTLAQAEQGAGKKELNKDPAVRGGIIGLR
jgi:hypothetical protein